MKAKNGILVAMRRQAGAIDGVFPSPFFLNASIARRSTATALRSFQGAEVQGVTHQMYDAGLDSGLREGGRDRLREALEAVHYRNQNVLHPQVFSSFITDNQKSGPLVMAIVAAQNLAQAVPADAEGHIDGLVLAIGLSASLIFTRKASKITIGYIRSKARDCHSRTSSSTALTRLIRSGDT